MNACTKNRTGLKPTSDFLFWHERDAIRREVFARDAPLCIWCHAALGDHRSDNYYTMDHVIPRSAGGEYSRDNLVMSCKACNTERGNMSVLQFMAHRANRDRS